MTGPSSAPRRRRSLWLLLLVPVTIGASVAISYAVFDARRSSSVTYATGAAELVYSQAVVPPRSPTGVDARCAGDEIASGGGSFSGDLKGAVVVLDSVPVTRIPPHGNGKPEASGWHVVFLSKASAPIKVGVVVACLRAVRLAIGTGASAAAPRLPPSSPASLPGGSADDASSFVLGSSPSGPETSTVLNLF